jgi:hypothetical protein
MKKQLASKKKRVSRISTITQRLSFNKADVGLKQSSAGLYVSLKGCTLDGEPGSPALPHKTIRIVLPKGSRIKDLKQKVRSSTLITHTQELVACVQEPLLALDRDLPHALQKRSYAVPDPDRYRKAIMQGKKICRVVADEMVGLIPCVLIEVWPIRYTRDGFLELATEIEISLTREPSAETARRGRELRRTLSPAKALRLHQSLVNIVVNPSEVEKEIRTNLKALRKLEAGRSKVARPASLAKGIKVPKLCDYLIVTDNNTWDEKTMQTTGSIGDLTSRFYKLAYWKESRGLRVHVARVKDIVDGLYGDFKTGALDLQEVIRNFLKWFCRSRGVDWVLLGGDVSIIPARKVGGVGWGQIFPGSTANVNQSEWKETYLGMRVETTHYVLGDPAHILTNYSTGKVIPYDASGSSDESTAGWYHTTDSTFGTRTGSVTEWIRVNGPENLVNAQMAWYTPNNLIPTDLYYASLYDSTLYNVPGKHDWDLLGNSQHGLYGQHTAAKMALGGIAFNADVCVGRASVETVDEAEVFVNKVLEYEKWGATQPASAYDRFRYMLYVSSNWNAYYRIAHDSANKTPPDDCCYATKGEYALLRLDKLPPDAGDQVICYFDDTYYKRLQYKETAGHNNPGWYYAIDYDDLTPSVQQFVFDGFLYNISFTLPLPTPWIVVWDGNDAVLHPLHFGVDYTEADSSMTDQEALREYMKSALPVIDHVERLYTDEPDLVIESQSDAPLHHLTEANLLDALTRGPHFASFSGHGNTDWCAYLRTSLVNQLTNGSSTTHMWVDSCLTGAFDSQDCVAEAAIKRPNGGALSYIGNTRYSWVGLGAKFREAFFVRMGTSRHLGELNDSRFLFKNEASGLGRERRLWHILVQHLFGDPEMPVYRSIEEAKNFFIGNHNTKELHDCRCQWVDRMSFDHKVYFETIDNGIASGYDGCGFCLHKYHHR